MSRFVALALLAPLMAGCGAYVMSVVAEPADAGILVSTTGPQGTFTPAGRGRAEVTMDFKSAAPIVVRVAKDGYATQDFVYGPGDPLPVSIVVTLDTACAVEAPETDRTADRILVVWRVSLAEVEEVERSPHVKAVTRLTNFRNEDRKFVQSIDVAFDRESPRIVFDLCESDAAAGTGTFLWMVRAGEPAIKRLSESAYDCDSDPAFSRDGRYFYFCSSRTGNPQIWRTTSAGSGGITRITSGTGMYFDPHATQGRLVYTEFFGHDRRSMLWVCNLEGGLPTQLREGEAARWSADGRRIAYLVPDGKLRKKRPLVSGRSMEVPLTKIWVMDSDGGNPIQLTTGDSMDLDPSWSPDGTKIAFASDRGKDAKGRNNFDIWMINADGTDPTQLTTNGSEDACPVWDAGGRHIYFRSNRGMGVNIWRMERVQ